MLVINVHKRASTDLIDLIIVSSVYPETYSTWNQHVVYSMSLVDEFGGLLEGVDVAWTKVLIWGLFQDTTLLPLYNIIHTIKFESFFCLPLSVYELVLYALELLFNRVLLWSRVVVCILFVCWDMLSYTRLSFWVSSGSTSYERSEIFSNLTSMDDPRVYSSLSSTSCRKFMDSLCGDCCCISTCDTPSFVIGSFFITLLGTPKP